MKGESKLMQIPSIRVEPACNDCDRTCQETKSQNDQRWLSVPDITDYKSSNYQSFSQSPECETTALPFDGKLLVTLTMRGRRFPTLNRLPVWVQIYRRPLSIHSERLTGSPRRNDFRGLCYLLMFRCENQTVGAPPGVYSSPILCLSLKKTKLLKTDERRFTIAFGIDEFCTIQAELPEDECDMTVEDWFLVFQGRDQVNIPANVLPQTILLGRNEESETSAFMLSNSTELKGMGVKPYSSSYNNLLSIGSNDHLNDILEADSE